MKNIGYAIGSLLIAICVLYTFGHIVNGFAR